MKRLGHYLFAGFTLSVWAGIFLYSTHQAWSARRLERALDKRGVIATAVITACHPGSKSTPVEFEYRVPGTDGEDRVYRVTNQGGGGTAAKCRRGKEIVIRYLPEAPERAQHGGASDFSVGILGAFASLTLLLVIGRLMIKEGIAPRIEE